MVWWSTEQEQFRRITALQLKWSTLAYNYNMQPLNIWIRHLIDTYSQIRNSKVYPSISGNWKRFKITTSILQNTAIIQLNRIGPTSQR